jgi:hypothetical protein
MIRDSGGRRDRRTLAVGVLAVAAILVAGRLAPAWVDWVQHTLVRVDHERALLLRNRVLLASARHDSALLLRRTAQLEEELGDLIASHSPSAAAAALAAIVADAAANAGLSLGPLQPMPDSSLIGDVHLVALSGAARGDTRAVIRMLAIVERHATALRIRDLRMTQTQLAGEATDPLEVAFIVEALARIRSGAS